MSEQWVTITDDAGIRTITFNRPDRRNALTPGMLEGLTRALEDVEPITDPQWSGDGQWSGRLARWGSRDRRLAGEMPAPLEPWWVARLAVRCAVV